MSYASLSALDQSYILLYKKIIMSTPHDLDKVANEAY